jgi:hypothetical protein
MSSIDVFAYWIGPLMWAGYPAGLTLLILEVEDHPIIWAIIVYITSALFFLWCAN